jgi:hypothetical protein
MTRPVDFGFTFDVPVIGEWESIDMARLALQTCVATLFRNVEHRDILAMVAGELLENAVKYARFQGDEVLVFRMRVWGVMGGESHVQVSNPADPESAQVVLDTVARIKAAKNTADLFRERLLEIAASPRRMSRLGLLRIAHEGGCRVDAAMKEDVLTITATVPCEA